MSKLWTDEDIAAAAAMWANLPELSREQRAKVVGPAIGRSPNGVLHRFAKCGPSFDKAVIPPSNKYNRAPDHVLAARDLAIATDTRSPAAVMLGEPPPGRSALDRYTPPSPPKHRAWADAFADKNIRLGGGR